MRGERRRSASIQRRTASVAIAMLVTACTHEVDPFQAYQGAQPLGTIGSSPGGDEGDASDESGTDEDKEESGEASSGGSDPGDDESSPAEAEGGSAPASDEGPADESGGAVDTGSGDPVLDGCLDVAANECETCACNQCLDPLYACQQDVGCVAMRDCAEQTGCVGADCLEPCGDVINMHGGPFGASGALALELSDCLSASCPACF